MKKIDQKVEEIENRQKLSKAQKGFVDSLKEIGYVHWMNNTYVKYGEDYNSIDVEKITKLEDLLLEMFDWGKKAKESEVKRVLNIAD